MTQSSRAVPETGVDSGVASASVRPEPSRVRASSRERKERFLRSFDAYGGQLKATKDAISDFLREDGLQWLTDEQLGQITARVLSNAHTSVRRTVRNREILRREAR